MKQKTSQTYKGRVLHLLLKAHEEDGRFVELGDFIKHFIEEELERRERIREREEELL
jgi:hypothetical protein